MFTWGYGILTHGRMFLHSLPELLGFLNFWGRPCWWRKFRSACALFGPSMSGSESSQTQKGYRASTQEPHPFGIIQSLFLTKRPFDLLVFQFWSILGQGSKRLTCFRVWASALVRSGFAVPFAQPGGQQAVPKFSTGIAGNSDWCNLSHPFFFGGEGFPTNNRLQKKLVSLF